MKRLFLYALILGIITSMALPLGVLAAAKNPCNPCSGKKNPCNPCNPCGMMKMFSVNDDRNVLTFESKAPLEKIVGTTSKITGKIHADPKDITKGFMAMFDLDRAWTAQNSRKHGNALLGKDARQILEMLATL